MKKKMLAALMAFLCCVQPVSAQAISTQSIMTVSSEASVRLKAGDLNLDDKLDILDVIILNQSIIGKESLTTIQKLTADANKDNKIDATDSLAIMKAIVGIFEKPSDKAFSPAITNLSKAVKADIVEGKAADDAFIKAQTGFYLHLFQQAEQQDPDKNILVSPYSVMQALAMTANGAGGQTLEEMEQTFGGLPLDDLNQYLYTQRMTQPNYQNCWLSTANSIWYRDTFADSLKPEFLKANADYYAADAFKAPFDDSTITDINTWVSNKTERMIPEILNPEEEIQKAVMYLVNAVTFEAEWETAYLPFEVQKQEFTAADGTVQQAEMMYSKDHDMERYYLHDENASGFYKYYSGERYAFAAMLPNEGISVDEYISGLTAESLQNTLANPEESYILAAMPKFSYDYEIELKDALSAMGMPSAFKETADFSAMTDTPVMLDKALHKTHIETSEEGTKAAAVTIEREIPVCETPLPEKEIILDRPFVYMIVDMENHLPVFMGTVKSVE